MGNLICLIFCWIIALINYFAFPRKPLLARLILAGGAFVAGAIQIPFVIAWLCK
jgi:hypothetical protein